MGVDWESATVWSRCNWQPPLESCDREQTILTKLGSRLNDMISLMINQSSTKLSVRMQR